MPAIRTTHHSGTRIFPAGAPLSRGVIAAAVIIAALAPGQAIAQHLAQAPDRAPKARVLPGQRPAASANLHKIDIPAPPAATIDLRRMHYGNPASSPPLFKVELPPPAGFRPALPVHAAAKPVAGLNIVLPPSAPLQISERDLGEFSPVAMALRDLLQSDNGARETRNTRKRRARKNTERLGAAEFYAGRQFVPVWLEDGKWTARARSVLTRLKRAGDDALDLGIDIPQLPAGEPDFRASPKALAEAELQLSLAAVRYGRYARGGRINVLQISRLITKYQKVPSGEEILLNISTAEFSGDALRSYNPSHQGYLALRAKLADLRAVTDQRELPAIAYGRTLRVGMRDKRVPLIRLRFGIPASVEKRSNLYDTKLASAVAKFQRSRGLAANGRLSRATIRALSTDSRALLINTIIANMESWRWLPADLGQAHIMVNIPEYRMRMLRGGGEIHSARVIVGQTKTQTPVFSDTMRYIVVNPYWNVPVSIIKKEMLPAYERDPSYFVRKGYEVTHNGKRLVVRQPPGPRNALGLVKFLFPNRHAVYLHDTPGRHRFRSSARALSHGCVRVQDPFKLAGKLLEGQRGWSERRLQKMVGGMERTIRLQNKMPIHIAYFTASVDENGELQTFRDIYGHNRRLQRLMGLRG